MLPLASLRQRKKRPGYGGIIRGELTKRAVLTGDRAL